MPRKSVKEERVAQILSGLHKCLLEKPFHQISIKDIAAQADVNHGMIHYFFKSKEDVLLHFIDYIVAQYKEDFARWLADQGEQKLSSEELLKNGFNYMANRITLNRDLSKVFIEIWAISNYNTTVREKLSTVYSQWNQTMLAELLLELGLPEEKTEKLSLSIIAFFEGLSLFSIVLNDSTKVAAILDEFQEALPELLAAQGVEA